MKSESNIHPIFTELKHSLTTSSNEQRKVWAAAIIQEKLTIRSLSSLLLLEDKIASRFLWLLTEIGEADTQRLQDDLVFLFDLCQTLEHIKYEASFANYWLICGVPIEKEAEYIDFLFTWLSSPKTNITTKSRSVFVLFQLTQKHPDIRNELKLRIHEQLDRKTGSFKKRALKILARLEK